MRSVPKLSRRSFVVGAAASAAVGYGGIVEPNWLEVAELDVPISGLPASLEGYRIAQVTDLHLRGLGRLHATLLARLQELEPQLVVISGDLIEAVDSLEPARAFCAEVSRIGARRIATLGNWEHWSGVPLDEIDALFRTADIELVVDDARLIDGIDVACVDDSSTGRANFQRAIRRCGTGRPSVLVSHAPHGLDRLTQARSFDLTMCGHTHGGQVQIFGWAPITPPGSGRFVEGWYETPLGRTYVCRGIGTSILPIRVGTRPELAVFTLRRA